MQIRNLLTVSVLVSSLALTGCASQGVHLVVSYEHEHSGNTPVTPALANAGLYVDEIVCSEDEGYLEQSYDITTVERGWFFDQRVRTHTFCKRALK